MRTVILATLLLLSGCDPDAQPSFGYQLAAGDGAAEREPAAKKLAQRAKQRPRVVKGARRAFEEVRELIAKRYVDHEISEDVLYSGALEGMLSRLIQLPEVRVNRLLDPWEVSELKLGIAGRFSGVGVVIKLVEGVCIVMKVIPGTPGAKAGLQKGDRILAVDGQDLARKSLAEIVGLIRGKAGTSLRLLMQRGRDEWEKVIARGSIVVPAIESSRPAPGVATIRIGELTEETVSQLDAQIERLRAARPPIRKLVLDLRQCPGGLLGSSVAVASRFLPKGALITTIERRAGERLEREARSADHPRPVKWPLVVLVDRNTLSGGEIIAAAIAENGRGKVVGERTAGKGSVEDIFTLRSGWSVKLSVGRFFSPRGRALLGKGVRPHFEVTRGKGEDDPQLRAALGVLALTDK